MYFHNVRGMSSKSSSFLRFVLQTEFDIYSILETNFHNGINCAEFFPVNYIVYRCDRSADSSEKSSGGGVLLAVNSKFSSQLLESPQSIECVCIKMETAGNTLIIISAYIPPKSPIQVYSTFSRYVNNLMMNNSCEDTSFLVMGDFNLPNLVWIVDDELGIVPTNVNSLIEREFVDSMLCSGLFQINYIKNSLDRSLDLIFTNFTDSFRIYESDIPFVINDIHHKPIEIVCDIRFKKNNFMAEEITSYDFKNANISGLSDYLDGIDWYLVFTDNDININVEKFYEIVYIGFDIFVPKRIFKKRGNYPPWFTDELISLRNKKNKYRCKFQKSKSLVDKKLKLDSQKLFNIKNNEAYFDYVNCIELNIVKDTKSFWKYVNSKRNTSGYPATMYYGNNKSEIMSDIVEYFREFFQSVYTSEDCSSFAENNSNSHTLIDIPQIAEADVLEALKEFRDGCGLDGIPTLIIKKLQDRLCTPLARLFNKSLINGVFPKTWKISKITPIYKSGDRSDIANYRGVAILSAIPKLFESIVTDYLFFNMKNNITVAQHGFYRGRSTVTNLVEFKRKVIDILENSKQVDVVYTDFSKAFDSIQHPIILKKLSRFGFSDRLISWIGSYLRDRIQYVKINGIISREINVLSGVPQGSHLGPLLFIAFINDLLDILEHSMGILYADDLKIFREVNNFMDVLKLQSDLNRLYDWCHTNLLKLNIKKCAVMSISRKQNLISFNYVINHQMLNRVSEMKDLGVTFDSKLNFISHINKIIAKSSSMLGFVKRFSKDFKNKETILKLYTSLVRPYLEYAAMVWAPNYAVHVNRIEQIQKRFSRYYYLKFRIFVYDVNLEYWENMQNMVGYLQRCMFLKLEPLYVRRVFAAAVLTADVLCGRIDCEFLLNCLNIYAPMRQLRFRSFDTFLVCDTRRCNYLMFEPIYFMTTSFNSYFNCFDFNKSKDSFKKDMKKEFFNNCL